MGKSTFAESVRAVVRNIPKGKTMSYSEVAAVAGVPGAARAVGSIMKSNYDTTVPCHRVIRSDGRVGEYNRGGPDAKRKLLQKEGANVWSHPLCTGIFLHAEYCRRQD